MGSHRHATKNIKLVLCMRDWDGEGQENREKVLVVQTAGHCDVLVCRKNLP